MVRGIVQDAAAAVRSAARRPGFTVAVLATLAIATGVTGTVAGVVDRVLVRPLPFAHADRVVGVWFRSPNFPGGLTRVRQSKATYAHLRGAATSFDHFALAEEAALTLEAGDRATRIRGAQVTASIFDVLGVGVSAGRRLLEADSEPGAAPVAVLSHATWRSRFNGDRAIVGRDVRLDGVTRRIVGVLGAGVRFPVPETEIWVPLVVDPANLGGQDFVYTGYGLVKPGVTTDVMQADFARAIDRLPDAYPETFPRPLIKRLQLSGLFVPLLDEIVGPVRRALVFALGAALIVLLTVFANLTNLFLLRHEGRHLELAVRAAMGAPPGLLARGVVVDATVHALAGGLAGLGLAVGALAWVREAAANVLPRSNEIGLDPMTGGLCLAATCALGLFVGFVAARRSRVRGLQALRGMDRTASSGRSAAVQWLLVGAQVALAVVVATGAGLLVRSATALASVNPGFNAGGLGGARLFLPATAYRDFGSVSGFFTGVVDELRSVSGVEGASAVSYLPLRDGRILYPYRFEGDPREDALPTPRQTKLVLDRYFETMGIPLVEGRTIERRDLETGSDAAVVNAAFAAAHWPGISPIGKRLRSDTAGPWLTVVGVAGNERDRQLADAPPPIVYLPVPGTARHRPPPAGDERRRQVAPGRGRVVCDPRRRHAARSSRSGVRRADDADRGRRGDGPHALRHATGVVLRGGSAVPRGSGALRGAFEHRCGATQGGRHPHRAWRHDRRHPHADRYASGRHVRIGRHRRSDRGGGGGPAVGGAAVRRPNDRSPHHCRGEPVDRGHRLGRHGRPGAPRGGRSAGRAPEDFAQWMTGADDEKSKGSRRAASMLRKSAPLVAAQRDGRIDPRGADGRHECRHHGRRQHRRGNQDQRDRIPSGHADESTFQEPSGDDRETDAHDNSRRRVPEAFANDPPRDAAR